MEGYGVKATEIRVVGGGSKNRLWRRIIADSFQLPLRFPTEPESAALGAALQAAAVHAGIATPEFIDSHSPPLADLVSLHACCMTAYMHVRIVEVLMPCSFWHETLECWVEHISLCLQPKVSIDVNFEVSAAAQEQQCRQGV